MIGLDGRLNVTHLGVTGLRVAGVINGLSISLMAPTVAVGTADDLIGLLKFEVGGSFDLDV